MACHPRLLKEGALNTPGSMCLWNQQGFTARVLGHAQAARLKGKDQWLCCLLGKARGTQQAFSSARGSVMSGLPNSLFTEGRCQAPGGPRARAGLATRLGYRTGGPNP